MKRAIPFFGIVWCLLAGATMALGQAPKPGVAVAPVAAIGEIDEAEKRIVFNNLQATLSRAYRLVPQEEYRRAEEAAFASLSVEQCTEEYCIRKIQELLQVERLIVLQIIRAGTITQLTLTLVRDQDKIVRAETCQNCGVLELNDRVARLVGEVGAADVGLVEGLGTAEEEQRLAEERSRAEAERERSLAEDRRRYDQQQAEERRRAEIANRLNLEEERKRQKQQNLARCLRDAKGVGVIAGGSFAGWGFLLELIEDEESESGGGSFLLGGLFTMASAGVTQTSEENECKKRYALLERMMDQKQFAAVFRDGLSQQFASASGEHLTVFRHLMGCPATLNEHFGSFTQRRFERLFPDADTDAVGMLINLKREMLADPELAANCKYLIPAKTG